MMLKLSLPVAPGLNNAFANVHGRGRTKTSRYRHWVKMADAEFLLQKRQLGTMPKITVPYDCHMTFPVIRGDLDGRAKLILDWMVSRELIIDDKHCKRLVLDIDEHRRNYAELVHIEVTPHGDAEHGEPGQTLVQRQGRGPIRDAA